MPLGDIVDEARERQLVEEKPRVVLTPRRRGRQAGFTVEKHGGTYGDTFRILGEKPERWVEQTDFTNDEAVGFLADRLQKLGIENALVKAGAVSGSTVIIGPGDGVVFDWEPSLTTAAEVQVGACVAVTTVWILFRVAQIRNDANHIMNVWMLKLKLANSLNENAKQGCGRTRSNQRSVRSTSNCC